MRCSSAVRYPVELDPRHLERLSGPLLTGVIELISNTMYADARSTGITAPNRPPES